jgi:hypothetical protein
MGEEDFRFQLLADCLFGASTVPSYPQPGFVEIWVPFSRSDHHRNGCDSVLIVHRSTALVADF